MRSNRLLFFFVVVMQPAAQGRTVSMEYSLGFDGCFQLGKWAPLTVAFENRGRGARGRCEIIVTSGSEYRQDVQETIYSADIELPYNSKKRCLFSVLITSYAHEMVIRLRQKEQRASEEISRTINLRPHYPETLKRLRENQFQAIEKWVRYGGFLFVASGINTGALLDGRTQRLLPVRPFGHKRFGELPSFQSFFGHPMPILDPFLVVGARVENATVLIKEKETGILFEKAHGNGNILFLAFDLNHPQFGRWDNRSVFWKKYWP